MKAPSENQIQRSVIELPFPGSELAGHNNGQWKGKSGTIAKHREWARDATRACKPAVPKSGDILVSVTFHPANNRGDRVNYPNRMKPYFDGIADALGVNDKRFVPSFTFGENIKGGKVIVTVEAA
jgi:hypothetical protein